MRLQTEALRVKDYNKRGCTLLKSYVRKDTRVMGLYYDDQNSDGKILKLCTEK